MSDIGDMWRAVKAQRKEENIPRTEKARADVEKLSRMQGVEVTYHTEFHVTFFFRGRAADFYPTTGKWLGRKPARSGYGISGAANFLGIKWGDVERAAELEQEQYQGIEKEGTDGEL